MSATCWASGNSATSGGPDAPTPVRTTVPGAIAIPPPWAAPTTVPVRGRLGVSGPGWSSRTLTS